VLWTTVLKWSGVLLLLLLPRPMLSAFMQGGAATMIPLTLAILLGVGLLVMIARVTSPLASPGIVSGTLGAMVLTIAVMSITRHQLRVLSLAPATGLSEPMVASQWFNFTLWVVLLVAALATVGYMVRRVLSSPATGADAA
jgi:pheromone shutdown protein TraB